MCAIICAEVISFATIFHPAWSGAVAVFLALLVFFLACTRPWLALPILAIEFLIGSKGALFKLGGNEVRDGGISVRILIFIAFFLGWFIWSVYHNRWSEWKTWIKDRGWYLALALLVFYAVVLGLIQKSPFMFVDANAWAVWLLLLPVIDLVQFDREKVWNALRPALIAGLMWCGAKTLLVGFMFTHDIAHINSSFYLWLRRSGVGEITQITDHAYRVFFQSQIYFVFALIFWGASWIERKAKKIELIAFIIASAGLLWSLSRSFWLGLGAGCLALLWLARHSWRGIARSMVVSLVALLVGSCLIWSLLAFPWPNGSHGQSFWQMIAARVESNEPGALSRWQLLPKVWNKIQEHPIRGSGFGATITYASADPRAQKAGGQVTAYALEWGWCDVWIKFGILGPLIFVGLLWSLIRRIHKSNLSPGIKHGMIASMVALAVIHFFTPYLNHPLGIAALIFVEGIIEYKKAP